MENQHRSLVMRLSLFLVLAILLAPAAHSHQVSQQMQQAQAALALGLPSQAARRLAEAARYSPWRSDLWELAGRYALQAGDHQLALDYLQRAERGGQLSAQGWIDLGDAYQASGDLPSAEQAWEASLAAGGDPDQLARRLARADLARGNYTSAIARLQALAAAQPGDAEVYYQSGLLIITKDPEAALEYLNRAAELDSSLEAPVSKLRRSVISARFAEDPAYTLLAGGRALASLGRWDLATQTFRAATQARPDYAEAWAYLGEALQHPTGRDDLGPPPTEASAAESSLEDSGLAEIHKALELDPQSLAGRTFLALYWSRRGRSDLALSAIQDAIQLDPENPSLQIQLADASFQLGDLEAAYQALQEALSRAPSDPLILRQVVELLLRYEYQLEEFALPVARRLVILDPQDAASLDTMAQVFIRLGDLSNAGRFLGRALQANPEYAPAHLHLAMLHILNSNQAAALEELELTSRLDPDGSTANQVWRMLETYFP